MALSPHSVPRRVRWRRPGAVVVLAAVFAATALTGSPIVTAQPVPTTPVPDRGPAPALVAQVAVDPLDPPSIQVSGVWITPPGAGAASGVVAVNVVFDTGFAVPREPWRVSVSVGDPVGDRVRASLVSVGSAGVSGRVERGDGVRWTDAGPTDITATGDGLVTIGVPISGVADGAVLWVDAEATVDRSITASRSPSFPLVDLLGNRPGPSLGTSPFAVVAGEPDAPPAAVDASGPTVQVVGRALEVTTTAAPPAEVDGVRVVDVIDAVTIIEGGSERTTGRIEIDRRTGEVRLATDGAEPFVAVPGTTPWLVNPPSPTAPGAAATVTFDLEALNQAVGGPAFDRANTRVAVTRTLALDDRRILEAAGVGGTMAWFDDSLTGPTAPTAASDPQDGVPILPLGAAVAVLAVAGVVLVLLVRRRRRSEEPRPIERLDPAPAPIAAGVLPLAPLAVAPVLEADRPGPAPAPPEPTAVEMEPELHPEPSLAARTQSVSTTDPAEPEPASMRSEGGNDAADPLAAFLAEVDELSARVDRLASVSGGDGGDRSRSADPPR